VRHEVTRRCHAKYRVQLSLKFEYRNCPSDSHPFGAGSQFLNKSKIRIFKCSKQRSRLVNPSFGNLNLRILNIVSNFFVLLRLSLLSSPLLTVY